jgi:Ser/Thr protein kinase RdoA (MazF antagonist)
MKLALFAEPNQCAVCHTGLQLRRCSQVRVDGAWCARTAARDHRHDEMPDRSDVTAMSEAFSLREACRQYTSSPVVATSHLEHGYANESHRVELADGHSIVVRILKLTTPERARQEISIQHALVDAGITTPVSQTMENGDVVGEVDGHAFTISHMIEGQHPQVVNEDLVTEFGRVLARFHNATQQLDIAGSSWLSEPTISQEIAAVEDRTMRLRLQQMRDDVLHLYDAGLPVANIHGDIWASNVFAENGRITAVFDLETTEKTLRVMDIGRTAIDLALEMKISVMEILEILRDGYEEIDALTDKERDALPDAFRLAVVACSAWNYNHGFQDYALDAMQHAESL